MRATTAHVHPVDRAAPHASDRLRARWQGGQPRIAAETRQLIREMAPANFLWSAPRIHGELPKLGIIISQATVVARSTSEAEMVDIWAEPGCRDCSQSDSRKAPLGRRPRVLVARCQASCCRMCWSSTRHAGLVARATPFPRSPLLRCP
jgi:hypothetical protein